MSTLNEFACPVCRAKQAQQAECRRCGADLSLWLKALVSLQAAQQQVTQAEPSGQAVHHDSLDYLRWLSPKTARTVSSSSCSSSTDSLPHHP